MATDMSGKPSYTIGKVAENCILMYIHMNMEPSPCACTNLRRAARALTQLYDDALAPAGLKVTQFSVIRALSRLESASITRLAEEVRLDRTTLARNLQILQRARLVVLVPGVDQREREVMLSPAGAKALREAIPLWEKAQQRVLGWLGGTNLGNLTSLLSLLETKAV